MSVIQAVIEFLWGGKKGAYTGLSGIGPELILNQALVAVCLKVTNLQAGNLLCRQGAVVNTHVVDETVPVAIGESAVLLADMGEFSTIVQIHSACLGLLHTVDIDVRRAVVHHTGDMMPLGIRVARVTAGIETGEDTGAVITPEAENT
jgi:hypothetical protein